MAVPGKVRIGSEFTQYPGATHNALVDDYWLRRAQPPNAATRNRPLGSTPYVVVLVKNSSGGDIEPGWVLGIDGPLFSLADNTHEFLDYPKVDGVTPDIDEHASTFVVSLDFIENGKIGRAVLVGAANVYVYFTDGAHEFAKVKDGDVESLESTSSGIHVYPYETMPAPEYLPAVLKCLAIIGGGGAGKNTTIVRATAAIPAGSGDPRTPGLSTDYEHIKGDSISGDIENWSTVEISDNSYMVILEIEGDNVIISAFC